MDCLPARPGDGPSSFFRRSMYALAWLASAAGCASIPRGQYGVRRIEWSGAKQMSSESLESCLVTKEREPFQLRLGLGSSRCGEPPFDAHVAGLSLWTWPWSEWPVYDSAVFEVDRKRIVRWYQARGFYDARVVDVAYTVDGRRVEAPEACTERSCQLTLHVKLEERAPVLVERVELQGIEHLAPSLQRTLQRALTLRVGRRFDEADYGTDRDQLIATLKSNGYARATIKGEVAIDRVKRLVDVRYILEPGPACRFGRLRVEGQRQLDTDTIVRVAGIRAGQAYDERVIADAELAVYGLGVFSTVRIEHEADEQGPVVDLVIRVVPGRRARWLVGAGLMSGSLQRGTSDETQSVPEWDVHLRAAYQNDDFLGGMRKLRIEDRPRLIFLRDFPQVPAGGARPGNALTVSFEQPDFLEARTTFFSTNQWDVGPDPFLGWFRHDLALKVGVRRKYFRQKLQVELALEHDLYQLISHVGTEKVSSYRLPFAEQSLRLDLRNDAGRPSRGVYLASTLQEAVMLGYGSWNYLRWLSEARAYQRLPWKIVLAERLAFGALFISDHDPQLDPTSSVLGPQTYRLRGGGANSNRGFTAGRLGDGIDGGTRRWEGSLELRIPLSTDLGLVGFFDAGDVSRSRRVRFYHLNGAVGFGLRYFTAFAPIRFDAGWRIPGWQVIGEPEPPFHSSAWPSAVHLTIGESF